MNKFKKFLSYCKTLDPVNTLFLTLTPFVAVIGMTYVISHHMLRWQSGVLFFVYMAITGLSITGGYHRLFAHKSYEASWPVRLIVVLFGSAAFQNSVLKWSSDHRNHHQFTDTDRDPYSIKKGFWHAHFLWVCEKANPPRTYDNVDDLRADPIVMFQSRHIFSLGVLFSFVLPAVIGLAWGDPWGALFFAGFTRMVMNHHFTFFINSLCHFFGNQPYATKDTSRDSWYMALFTFGEGYHNFHHSFPADYRNGIKAYHFDPTKWAIWLSEKLGMARNLKRIPTERPQLSRISLQERRIMDLIREKHGASFAEMQQKIRAQREQFEKSYLHFLLLKREYVQLKKQKMHDLNDQMQARYLTLKEDFKIARANFKAAAQEWASLHQQVRIAVAYA